MDFLDTIITIIDDPRAENVSHPLSNIVFIAVAAGVSGFLSPKDIVEFAEEKLEWFEEILDMSSGIPSHHTFRRLLSALDPNQFLDFYLLLVRPLLKETSDHVAVDGKTLRGSGTSEKAPLHLVHAWAVEAGVVIGQTATAEKSNEITAIPELLRTINPKGKTISIDAMGCQRDICEQILKGKGDYVIAVKGNQKKLFESIKDQFNTFDPEDLPEAYSSFTTTEKSRGAVETREYSFTGDVEWVNEDCSWPGLKCIGKVTRTIEKGENKSSETRYFISSLEADAEKIARIVRDHWRVENNLHWSLDVYFDEDKSKISTDFGAENLSILRKISLALAQPLKDKKLGPKRIFRKCCLNDDFRLKVLSGLGLAI